MISPFQYPEIPHNRRHGPRGYADHLGYRDWLRDEFSFRCVYCLIRERWVHGGFNVDHYLPVISHPELALDYNNLLYSCATCNSFKSDFLIPDPLKCLIHSVVRVENDGTVVTETIEATRIVRHIGLNRPQYRDFRRTWIRIISAIKDNQKLLAEVLGYPEDLPDLSILRPPLGNDKPEGIQRSYCTLKQNGELSEIY